MLPREWSHARTGRCVYLGLRRAGGHTGIVRWLALPADAALFGFFLSAGDDKAIRVWRWLHAPPPLAQRGPAASGHSHAVVLVGVAGCVGAAPVFLADGRVVACDQRGTQSMVSPASVQPVHLVECAASASALGLHLSMGPVCACACGAGWHALCSCVYGAGDGLGTQHAAAPRRWRRSCCRWLGRPPSPHCGRCPAEPRWWPLVGL